MKTLVVLILFGFLAFAGVYAQDMDKDMGMQSDSQKQMMDGQAMDKDMHKNMMGQQTESKENLGICPVMGGKAREDYSYTYQGKTYHFCCPGCIESFKNDPEKYISKIKEISLEAYKFGYEPETITVKKGDIVRLIVSSRDVAHGVYIKEYDLNIRVDKGEEKRAEFLADKTGEFDILCSVYCGSGHKDMKAKLIVEE